MKLIQGVELLHSRLLSRKSGLQLARTILKTLLLDLALSAELLRVTLRDL